MNSLVPTPSSVPAARAMAPDVGEDDRDGFALDSMLGAARRRFRLFCVVFLVLLAAAAAITFHQSKAYTASANVLMDPRQLQLAEAGSATITTDPSLLSAEAVETQAEIIKSRSIAEAVDNRLDLDARYGNRSKIGLRGRLVAALASLFGERPEPPTAAEVHAAVVDNLMSSLVVERVGLSYIIGIDYTDADPQLAAQVANTIAQIYVEQTKQEKSENTQEAGGYISSRLRELSENAAHDAGAVELYKVAHNLLGAKDATVTDQEVTNVDQQIATARADAAADQARLTTAREQLRRGSNGEDVGEALESPTIQSLDAQRATAAANLAELNSRYGPRYPEVIKAKSQLGALDEQIHGEILKIMSNLQARADVSNGRLRSLEGTLSQSRGTLATNTEAEAGLTELEQKAAASQALYDTYLARFKELMASAGSEQSDARVVAVAQVPQDPSSPRVALDLALGTIVAAIFAFAAGFVAEMADRSLSTGQEVEHRLHVPYLVSIPLLSSIARKNRRSPADYVAANPFSVFAESFRNLRVSIIQSRENSHSTVVSLTSPLTGEGKTTTAVCLGKTTSMQGVRTIVVDCDLRRRGLQKHVKEPSTTGLIEVLTGKATLAEVIVSDEETGLCYLPIAGGKLSAKDLFSGDAMDALLAELRRNFAFIILDTPPLLAVVDARVLAAKSDAVVMLARWRKTPRDALSSALRLVNLAGAPLVGVVLTRVDVTKLSAHGYGDSTYYYRAVQQYYAS
jgi:succinoglycan biosynthesis transport protein ExoP